MLITLSGGAIVLGGLIGYGCAHAISVKRKADDLKAQIEAEEKRQRMLSAERRWLAREISFARAEIAKRKRQKKAGQPVGPIQAKLEKLTTRKLKMEGAA